MKVPIYRTYSSQVALLTIACFLHATVGCGGAPASGTVFIRVTDPAGQITEKTFTHEEFATSAKGSVDQLMAPDEASIDPARILSEGSVSLKLASGKVLELKTEGNRVALADGTNAASLSWNADRTELTIETPGGKSKVELTGAHDPATPLAWARSLTASIDRAVLLIRTDDGHTGLINSACARAAEVKYLVTGVTPPRGAVCH